MLIFSPAKINLGLIIGDRRLEDSYHYLTSLFIPIRFGDYLEIQASSKDIFISENLIQPPKAKKNYENLEKEKNLVWKVLKITRSSRKQALHVHLKKHIPPSSGLGGASSNAGILLKYMQKKGFISTPLESLEKIALSLGADVPFFLQSKPALVRGIGEIWEPFLVASGWGVLGFTDVIANTVEGYKQLKRPLHEGKPPNLLLELSREVKKALSNSHWHLLSDLQNDFEEPLFLSFPELRNLKRGFLEEGALFSLMSGSGSTIYALVENEQRQKLLLKKMEERFPNYYFAPFSF